MMRLSILSAIAGISITVGLCAGSIFAQQNPRDLYQRALMLDESMRNYSEAIRLYSQVVSLAIDDRALAAKAQRRIALIYERLGRQAKALQAYRAIVAQYPDQIKEAEQAREKIAAAGSNLKKEPKFIVKNSGPSPDGRFLATFTFHPQSSLGDFAFALASEQKRLYVVTKRIHPIGKDPASKRALERGLQQVYEPSTLIVIDTQTNSVIKSVALTVYIGCLVFNPATNKLYGNAVASGHVLVIDANTLAQTTIPLEGYPGGIAVNPTANRIYVASQGFEGNDKVFVIDAATNRVLTRLDLDGVAGGTALVFNSATNRLYVSTGETFKTRVFNVTDNSLVTDLPGLHVIGVDPDRNKIYAYYMTEKGSPVALAVHDGNTHEMVTKFGFVPRGFVAVNPHTGRVYVPHRDTKNVSIIDGDTNGEISRVSFADVVTYMDTDPTNGQIYVSCMTSALIGVVDKDSLEEDASAEFFDDFGGPGLDPAWTIAKGVGTLSLAENPGHLRLRIRGSHARDRVLLLFRRFQGESWILETKASYFTGSSGDVRSFDLIVAFGKRPPRAGPTAVGGDPDRVLIRRHRGDWNGCCPGTTEVLFYDNGSVSSDQVPPTSADAYIWRIKRNGRTVAVERSDDGVDFVLIGAHTFGAQIDGLIQYVGLTYHNWQNNNAYADYDYIRLIKHSSRRALPQSVVNVRLKHP